jgi:5-methylthioadenosine/S-adenosylhomocysteine deaminase
MNDIIIEHGILITMDPARRILEDGAIVINKDRILAVGETAEIAEKYQASQVINARNKVVMPGLIDGHAHAGHALVKTAGTDLPGVWDQTCKSIYLSNSSEEFWYAEALLSGLERLKCGVTTSVNFFGGGNMYMRTDNPSYGSAHCRAIEEVGIREFLAVGPGKPPFPIQYSQWSGDSRKDVYITFDQQIQTCADLIQAWHKKADGRIHICVMFISPKPGIEHYSQEELQDLKQMTAITRELTHQYGVRFAQDGHSRGTIKFTHEELGLLGPDAFISHNIDITAEEIEICRQTNTKIVHNPSAIMSILGRCPVPELLDAGVTVFLGSDGVAPDRSYDMFRHMFQAMRYHRRHYKDPSILPPGKVLEMVTIDAAKGLGLEDEIGSLEAGKKADIILIDMLKPHLFPLNMPAYRVAYFANGADVDTVIIDGKILMQSRQVNTVNEMDVLMKAQKESDLAFSRAGLQSLFDLPDKFWGHSRY